MRFLERSLLVDIATIKFPPDWRRGVEGEGMDLANILGMARDLNKGLAQGNIRLEADRTLSQGAHRIAAHLLAPSIGPVGRMSDADALALIEEWVETGETPEPPRWEIYADVVEYTGSAEGQSDRLIENLRRRHLSDDEKRAGYRKLVALYEAEAAEELEEGDRDCVADQLQVEHENFEAHAQQLPAAAEPAPEAEPAKAKPGRPKDPKRQAIKKAAKATGRNETTVARALKDPPKKEQADEDPTTAPAEVAACLDWFDVEPNRDVDGQARKVAAQVWEVDMGLKALKRQLTGLRELGHPNALCDSIEEAYTTLAHLVRRSKPVSACHACKGGPTRKDCFDCLGTGYASKAQAEGDVPPELLQRGDLAMVRDGRGGFRSLVAVPEVRADGAVRADLTPESDPEPPYEPSAGEIVIVRWNPQGDVKKARFVRLTKSGRSMVVQVARVDRKGKTTGEWGDDRTFDRSELMGPAEGLPF
jgi:hypothetical protein